MLIRMLLKAFPEKNNALRVSHKVFKKEKKEEEEDNLLTDDLT